MEMTAIRRSEWVKNWAGGWSLLTCTYLGEQYTHTLWSELGTGLRHAVLLVRGGYSTCLYPKPELDSFGAGMADRVVKDNKFAKWLCSEVKKRADRITSTMHSLASRQISEKDYSRFLIDFYQYVSPHVCVKRVPDYLPQKEMQRLLPQFEAARLNSEHVYADTEKLMEEFAKQVGRKNKLAPKLVLCCTKEEIAKYFRTGKLPAASELEKRWDFAALVFENGEYKLLTGPQAAEVEKAVHAFAEKSKLSGKSAFPGIARGRVRIVIDPTKARDFRRGDVLVTGMTRPTFLPLMEKACAFVTDAGGILSHAAIVAREMRKPCIVGTERATKVLKDGDRVEVDATKGTVRKIS